MTAQLIADRINASGQTYYGDRARAWSAGNVSRIYFGRDYVTVEGGEAHNRTAKARAKSIGESAVEIVASVMGEG
jgi:hypothetical protein